MERAHPPGDTRQMERQCLRLLDIEAHSVLEIGCGDLVHMGDFSPKAYTGIDTSEDALEAAREKRKDWTFLNAKDVSVAALPDAEYGLCFDSRIQQAAPEDPYHTAEIITRKVTRRLVLSGHSEMPPRSLLPVSQVPLYRTLKKCGQFESIIRLFHNQDTDYYVCDVRYDHAFWLNALEGLLRRSLPQLVGKKVLLHIGTPKTGTSSLQHYFYQNRGAFLNQGILYPDFTEGFRHQPWFDAMRGGDWHTFVACLEENLLPHVHTLVLSSEGFYNHASTLPAVARTFLQALARITDFRVVVYLRNRSAYFNSYYRQAIINPKSHEPYGTSLKPGEMLQNQLIQKNLDYEKSLQAWVEIAGEEHLIVRPYLGDTVKDFLGLLQADAAHFAPAADKNPSLPPIAIEIMRRCNAFLGEDDRKALVAVLREVYAEPVNDTFAAQEVAVLITAAYGDSDRRLLERWPQLAPIFSDVREASS